MRVLPALSGVIALLAGCGGMFEQANVTRSFRNIFGCPTASVRSAGENYYVAGCGKTALYTCYDTDPGSEEPLRQARPGGGRLIGAAIGSAILDGMEVDTCVLSEVLDAPKRTLPRRGEHASPDVYARRGVVSTTLVLPGATLRLRGRPHIHPDRVLLELHATARLPEVACNAALFDDGVALPVLAEERVDAYTLRLLLPRSALVGVKSAVRMAGQACGYGFELQAAERAAVAEFDARFGELLSEGAGLAVAR
ncbi:MAG: hypothetical protein RL385_2214 [Pseudomonadota bacterium]|jgi:hypothetical protein